MRPPGTAMGIAECLGIDEIESSIMRPGIRDQVNADGIGDLMTRDETGLNEGIGLD